jgi:WD40 repeat protein
VIVSGSDDQTVRVWDATTGTSIGAPLVDHSGGVWSVGVGCVGGCDVIVSGSDDGSVRAWDVTTGALVSDIIALSSVNSIVLGSGDLVRLVVGADAGVAVMPLTDFLPTPRTQVCL